MAYPTAVFPNGYQDVYKGARKVKAAWAIVRKSDGKVISSGHSLDRDKAAKTADGNLRYFGAELEIEKCYAMDVAPRHARSRAYWESLYKSARTNGYDGATLTISRYNRFARDWNAERKAQLRAASEILIVDIEAAN